MAELPVEELARIVLHELTRRGSDGIAMHNWILGTRKRYKKSMKAMAALSEAVAFLRIKMILVDDLNYANHGGGWMALSREGKRWQVRQG
ncbi:hypothetical protein [Streptomyces wedmorensis]